MDLLMNYLFVRKAGSLDSNVIILLEGIYDMLLLTY